MSALEVQPGRPFPLGANWDGSGVNFALFSAHAERVDLCLFDLSLAVDQRNDRRTEIVLTPGNTIEAELTIDSLYDLRGASRQITVSCEIAGRTLFSNPVTL